jgi:hypothetical protein
MTDFEDFKLYLPKYLSPESSKQLFDNLKDFSDRSNKNFYSNCLGNEESIFQGDIIENLPNVKLPEGSIFERTSVILTNTCDNDLSNIRRFPSYLSYTPLVELEKYKQRLVDRLPSEKSGINDHIETIRKQSISQIFYFPIGSGLDKEYIMFFDTISSCPASCIAKNDIPTRRISSLSNYGFYLFLFKLSIHFTRFGEAIDRNLMI